MLPARPPPDHRFATGCPGSDTGCMNINRFRMAALRGPVPVVALLVVLFAGAAAPPLRADLHLGVYPAANFFGDLEIETVGFEGSIRADWRPPFLAGSVPRMEITSDLGYSVVDLGEGVQQGVFLLAGAQYHLDIASSP